MNVSFLVDDYHFNSRLANASFFNVLGRHIYSTWPSKKWKQQERERETFVTAFTRLLKYEACSLVDEEAGQ